MSAQAVLISTPHAIHLERILYATDFSPASERALPIVSAIARHYDSQVVLAHVWSPEPYPLPYTSVFPPSQDENQARKLMNGLVRRPELSNLRTAVELEGGSPVERIEKYVKKHSIDLVILGTHGHTGMKHSLMGSVAEELFRNLTCSVLTIGPALDTRFNSVENIKSILFPTDLSPESKAVFPYVASLAAEFGAELVVLHVLPVESESNPEARKLAEPLRDEMERIFAPSLGAGCKARYLLEFGDVARRILSAADYYKSDLIGLGVRQGNHLVTHFRGTAAYRVLVGAPCPVLTVRGTL
jgi:nucleotide-binding universal stress UspA family protein